MSCTRIRDWINEYGEDGVYISFSGGKDSTVLMDLVRNQCGYKDVKAMFVDIPTQFPELRRFVEKYENVDIVTPKYNFFEVCEKYGFPLISKEAAECVYGARKYLASLQNDGIIPTGEQTGSDLKKNDRIARLTESSVELASILNQRKMSRAGGGEPEVSAGNGMAHARRNDKGEHP